MDREPEADPLSADEQPFRLRAIAASVFTHAAPIDKLALFAGRTTQVTDLLSAVLQKGQHAIIYGERGVGKTSLATVLGEIVGNAGLAGFTYTQITCDSDDTFGSLWYKLFRNLTVTPSDVVITTSPDVQRSFDLPKTLVEWLPPEPTTDDIRRLVMLVHNHLVAIVDEFDRLPMETSRQFADLVKVLSDQASPVTLVLVGVADSVDELIHEHASIDRALVEVQMPRMDMNELTSIIHKGLRSLDMSIEDDVMHSICALSQGLPTYTHLLSYHAVNAAIDRQSLVVQKADLDAGMEHALRRLPQTLLSVWNRATSSPKPNNLFKQVLVACALTKGDDLGLFAAGEMKEAFRAVIGRPFSNIGIYSQHLHLLTDQERGMVLERRGKPYAFRFRFRNPLMRPFVVMHGLATGLITEKILDQFQ